jgi:hypothetical protein
LRALSVLRVLRVPRRGAGPRGLATS